MLLQDGAGGHFFSGDEDFVHALLGAKRADGGETPGDELAGCALFRPVAGAGDEIDGEDAAGGEGALREAQPIAVALLRTEDIVFPGEIEIVDDDIEFPGVPLHPCVGVGDDDLRAGFAELHFLAGQGDELAVEIDAGERCIRQ